MIKAFFSAHLSPGERLGEILCGLIMTLTFTLGASVLQGQDGAASDSLMYATIGCNAAWGIIDGVLLVFARMFDRGRLARLADAIRREEAEHGALGIVADEFDDTLAPISSEEARRVLYRDIVSHVRGTPSHGVRLMFPDLVAAAAAFASVFIATLPAVIPYLVISDPSIALRTSNALLVGMLFWVGFHWAAYTRVKPLLAGVSLTMLGIALVAVAMALGG